MHSGLEPIGYVLLNRLYPEYLEKGTGNVDAKNHQARDHDDRNVRRSSRVQHRSRSRHIGKRPGDDCDRSSRSKLPFNLGPLRQPESYGPVLALTIRSGTIFLRDGSTESIGGNDLVLIQCYYRDSSGAIQDHVEAEDAGGDPEIGHIADNNIDLNNRNPGNLQFPPSIGTC